MVQILQPDNTAATQRQLALEQFQQGLAGLAQMQQTKRAQALADQNAAMEYRKAGYDVSPEMIAQQREQTLNPELLNAQGPGVFDRVSSFFTGKEAVVTPGQEKVDLFGKRTQEYQDKLAMEQAKVAKELENQAFDRRLKEQQLAASQAEMKRKGDESQRDFELKKEELAIKRAQASGEVAPSPEKRLAKMGAEGQGKVASVASGLRALEEMKGAMGKGFGPRYVNPNTAILGAFTSDDPFSKSQRVLSEVVGRLQSGGAIGEKELESFNAMGPRPSDSPEIAKAKLDDQRRFLTDKLAGFGFKESELAGLGFNIPQSSVSQPQGSQSAMAGDMAAKAARLQELRAKAGK